ncbi:MAG: hypothetical protein M9928_04145 [Anaerolineae bacterium]|nr:hypothetical protein [Anaerolineae bacterium]MCO5196959.1 hypothetical protein [Anaerolineae bacterium]MCO5204193.1 hypothetical protein [Anaerolineae bacterium]
MVNNTVDPTVNGSFAEHGRSDAAGDTDSAEFSDLFHIGINALRIRPPRYAKSILGAPGTWVPPYRRYSEFSILNLWRPMRTANFLFNITVPALPIKPPPFGPPVLNNLFWKPTVILHRPDHNGDTTTFPDEAWFFINGMMTDDHVAQINAAYLSHLFHRPITIIQNSTDSGLVDFLQCMVGKEWQRMTEPAIVAFPPIYDALKSRHKQRVVVIAHSQGTIILANVLRMLYSLTPLPRIGGEVGFESLLGFAGAEFVWPDQSEIRPKDFDPLTVDELARLEVYSFATCANNMPYHTWLDERSPVPWIEHFGNEYDIVARLGMLAPDDKQWDIKIEGLRYVHRSKWGHLLNEHYLFPIADYQKDGRKREGIGCATPFTLVNAEAPYGEAMPRLFSYINGGPKNSVH